MFVKGHKQSVGNSGGGRKTLAEEVAKIKSIQKAWNKINNEIDNQPVDRIALPIALKSMVDKSEVKQNVTINFDPIFNVNSTSDTENNNSEQKKV